MDNSQDLSRLVGELAAKTERLIAQAGQRTGNAGTGTRLVGELVVLGIQLGDLTAALEDAAAGEAVVSAAYAQGRADEAAEHLVPRARGRSRSRHLQLVAAT